MKTRLLSLLLVCTLLATALCGCAKAAPAAPASAAPAEKPVTLRVVSPWTDFPALELVAERFTQQYPNCKIEYEYLQEYYESLEKRLLSGEDTIDVFVTTNIQEGNTLLPYTLDLYSDSSADLALTFEGLIRNFELRSKTDGSRKLYALPLGAEIRGMYANVTLLKSCGLSVPKNRAELLEACRVLREKGYYPMQSNPGMFSQQLLYPYVCNLIANAPDYEATFARVSSREAGLSELFREPMALLYELVEKHYYDYKAVENELKLFSDASNAASARYFLNIQKQGEQYVKTDDLGKVPFMPATLSLESTLAKAKSDYHSEIDYQFLLAPVGEEGGYAYLSPAHGIGVNKNSPQREWAVKFINFLFTPEINRLFAEAHQIIPNTKDAFAWVEEHYNIPENHISHLGEVTFDYGFYKIITTSLTEVSKGNNPKYMQKNSDGSSSLYPLEYYMERLEQRLVGTLES